jgi:ribosomal protein S18 acetylase RimI-like enzyme
MPASSPGAPLFAQLALPDDPDLDDFDSGVAGVTEYFRRRTWFDAGKHAHAPPTYQFRTEADGEVVGYAAVSPKKLPHPEESSPARARYLVIYVVGLHRHFQGRRHEPYSEQTYAVSVFRVLERLAREAGCVGMSLRVRADNARAIALYRKLGFQEEGPGPVQREEQAPQLTMRWRF